MTGTYHLSYDEQQTSKTRMLANARLQRLLQVRAQDKQLARARSRRFKQLCADSAEQLKEELVQLLTEQRAHELARLKAQYQAALDGLASAQRDAAVTAQQLARERQQKHQQFLQREKDAQERFVAALARVQAAQQAELQVVLDKIKRRNDIMQQQRDLAKTFAEQQKQQAARDAQRQAEVDLLEEQRRRQNQVSKIDFRYSRLHELGVPQVVVNHKALPHDDTPDAATQAQEEAARLQEQQRATQQRQQDDAKKAAARGVHAQLLVQAERNRQRMEQALRELESHEVEQRKQNVAVGNLTAAPLLRRWQQQKRRVLAKRAFENDFLPHPAAAQGSFPTFLAYEENDEASIQQVPKAATQAYAADKALKLVAELERQRKMERSAAQQQQSEQQQQGAPASTAATFPARRGSSAASSEIEVPVPVGDLIDFIPAAEATGSSPTATSITQTAATTITSTPRPETAASDAEVQALSSTAEPASASSVRTSQSIANLEAVSSDGMQQASASTGSDAVPSLSSSQDLIAAIMQAADEVLQQLPAEMQAAAARRAAAAAGLKAPLAPTLQSQAGVQAMSAGAERRSAGAGVAVAAPIAAATAAESADSREMVARSSRATDSSTDAAAILQELHELQEQLGLEYLGSSTAGSDLEQLAAFDQEVQDLVQQQMQQLKASAAAPTARPTAASHLQPHIAATSAQMPLRASAGVSAMPQTDELLQQNLAALPAAASEAAAHAVGSLLTAATTADHVPENTDLEALVDRVLAPDYPSNLFQPLADPQPSVDSPTRPAGRSGRRAAAAEVKQQDSNSESHDLAAGFRELQRELMALGLPDVNLSRISSSTSGGDDAFLRDMLQGGLSSSSSEVTLPTTVVEIIGPLGPTDKVQAAAAAVGESSGSKTASSTVLESGTGRSAAAAAAAAATAAVAASLRSSIQQQQLQLPDSRATLPVATEPGDVAAAAMAAAKQALLDLSSSMDSLSVSNTDSGEVDRLLQGVSNMAQTSADATNRAAEGGMSVLSSSMTSLPSTLLHQPAAAAARNTDLASDRPSLAVAAAAVQGVPASENISLPDTLQLQQEISVQGASAAATGQAAAAAARGHLSAVDDQLAALRELLSLRDSESSVHSVGHWRATAAAATAGGPPSVSSSSISSMLDDELDQLLQKALAGVGSTQQQQQQQQISIEKALEAMAQVDRGTTSGTGAAAAVAVLPPDVQSMSTTIPSTVQAIMPGDIAAAAAAAMAPVAARGAMLPGAAAAGDAAARSPSQSNSDSSSSRSGSGSHSSHSSTSLQSEAALTMAKQSARQRAAATAAAAAAAATAAGSAGGGWTSSSTSIPSTIEGQLEAAAAVGMTTASTTEGSAAIAAPSVAASASSQLRSSAATARRHDFRLSADSLERQAAQAMDTTTGMEGSKEQHQQQQVVGEGWPLLQQGSSSAFEYGSSSSSSLSLPSTLWQQQQPPARILPSVPVAVASSSSSSRSRHDDTSSRNAAAASATPGMLSHASTSTAGPRTKLPSRQQQQQRLPAVKQANKPAAASAVLPVLYPIQEEMGVSLNAESSPQGTASTGKSSESQLNEHVHQQQVTHPHFSVSSSSAVALQGEDSGSTSTPGSQISSSSTGDTLSSDSFSGAVSELMQHIDSTLASLAGVSSSAASDLSQPVHAAVAGSSVAAAGTAARFTSQQHQAPPGQPLQVPGSSRSADSGSTSSSSPTVDTAGLLSGVPNSGGNSSSSSSGATDSSTARLLEQALAAADFNLTSPASSAGSARGDTGTSRLLNPVADPAVSTSSAAGHTSLVKHPAAASAADRSATAAAAAAATTVIHSRVAPVVSTCRVPSVQQAAAGGQAASAAMTVPSPETVAVTSSADTEELLGSLGSLLAASTPSSGDDSGIGSGSEFSFHAALRSSSITAGLPLDDSGAVLQESPPDTAVTSSASSQQQQVALPSVHASTQAQQQVPVATSGLSQLLAEIIADDPELAAQLSSQSMG